jgi:hypothetical protein
MTDTDDRVLGFTRGLAAAIVPFLLVAFAVLYPWPGAATRIFAWPVRPGMTAMTLGAAYLGGAYYFLRVALARRWHTVKAGLPPVALFATLLGAATLVHWDRFSHRHVAFWLWAGLYFTTPVLVAVAWWRNRRHDRPAAPTDALIPAAARLGLAVTGALALLTGAVLTLFPATVAGWWPWPLTPLTGRVTGAVLCLGGAGLGVLWERRRSAARIPLQVAALMLVLLLVAGVRAHAQFASGRPLTWVFIVGFGGATVAALAGCVLPRPRPAAPADGAAG